MKTEPNEPATPSYDCDGRLQTNHNITDLSNMGAMIGLTKREMFAAMAMQGLLANPNGGMQENNATTYVPELISKLALLHADALITALNN